MTEHERKALTQIALAIRALGHQDLADQIDALVLAPTVRKTVPA